jgi:hypothetical protein
MEAADAATSIQEIEALRSRLSGYLVMLGEIRGANRANGNGKPTSDRVAHGRPRKAHAT